MSRVESSESSQVANGRTSVVRPVFNPNHTPAKSKIHSSQVSVIKSNIIMRRPIIVVLAAFAQASGGQYADDSHNYADYADGQDDNLYANYAAKHQATEV